MNTVPDMQFTKLGKTGMRVSVAGLGCGGGSRLGMAQGLSTNQSVDLVRLAMDLGVNYLDTAAIYGTEPFVGKAIKCGPRDQICVATKAQLRRNGTMISVNDRCCQLRKFTTAIGYGLRGCLSVPRHPAGYIQADPGRIRAGVAA